MTRGLRRHPWSKVSRPRLRLVCGLDAYILRIHTLPVQLGCTPSTVGHYENRRICT